MLVVAMAAATWVSAQNSPKGKAASAGTGLQATLEKLERAGWDAYKNKDKKAFADLLTDDYTAGLADGKGGRDKQSTVNSVDEITLHRYSLSNFKLTKVSGDAALLTYDAEMNLSIGKGKPEDAKIYVGDLWVKRGGQWKSLHYQETERK